MRYAGIVKNDTANAPDVCVSFYIALNKYNR